MTLLLRARELPERQALATSDSLAPLARSLRHDLSRLVAEGATLPDAKAKLTRTGGRCLEHGVLLAFDPWEPRMHRCPTCGRVYDDEVHYRWWIMNRQLWIAERAVHGALLGGLTSDTACTELAGEILEACAARYLDYPNSDNVLGPSRPFFSTYLESIWTLQLAIALDFLESFSAGDTGLGQRVRERVLAPAADLIASFDEGMSNRQVWNNAALVACGRLLDRPELVHRALTGPSGLDAHLRDGLLADGSWYEGENYHQFAHRGLWYAVVMGELAGHSIPPDLAARFQEAFALPFLTALPDFTFPARRDSQYRVSLRQWRYAESCELGLARRDDPRLSGALAVMYRDDHPAGPTGRATSTAEAERNEPATRLDRSSLGWKSLLCARRDIAATSFQPPAAVHLPSQGLAIFRRKGGRVYTALDYGTPGGGHGHPDRLNLWLVHGSARLLEDVGTGSYTDPSLFWYRSTLAHNAPLIDGVSQPYGAGTLSEYRPGDPGVIAATFDAAPDTRIARRVTVFDDCLVDEVRWVSARDVEVTLPWHVPLALREDGAWKQGNPPVSMAAFVRDVEMTRVGRHARFTAERNGQSLDGWVEANAPFTWGRAQAPGPPGEGAREFTFWSGRGTHGRWRTVLAWSAGLRVVASDVHVELHWPDGRVQSLDSDHAQLTPPAAAAASTKAPRAPALQVRPGAPLVIELGRAHYRRSELSWDDAGSPMARVTLAREDGRTTLDVDVRKDQVTFAPQRADNPLDNEHPDINSDGVQIYLVSGTGHVDHWILVPEAEPTVRVTSRAVPPLPPPFEATWRLTPHGWALRCAWPPGVSIGAGHPFRFNVVINEISPDRERRRGQLVATGASGEWVYLRGDREDPTRLIETTIRDD